MPNIIRVVKNTMDPDTLLTPQFFVDKLMKQVSSDPFLSSKLTRTPKLYEKLTKTLNSAECRACDINKKAQPVIKVFVAELKGLSQDDQAPFYNIMGQRSVVSIAGKWINLRTNEVSDIVYEEKTLVPNAREKAKKAKKMRSTQRKIIFKNFQGPGDVVMMTAAIRDLHMNHPNKYATDVRTTSIDIWENNPYITHLNESDPSVEVIELGYPLIQQSNQGPFHFSEAFTEEIEDKLNIRIKKRLGRGDIHIGPNEEVWGWTERTTWFEPYGYDPNAPYWIIDAGHKLDFTAKMWSSERYQEVVDYFMGEIQFVQIGHKEHIHPPLDGVINLVGKTDDRQLIRLIWGSSGVLTPVSYPMVICGATPVKPGTCNGLIHRPCVVISGGREPSRWQAHTTHQFLHNCGTMPCSREGACWASRVFPIGDGDDKDSKNMCLSVVELEDGTKMPYCLYTIEADDVIRAIERYYMYFQPERIPLTTYNQE